MKKVPEIFLFLIMLFACEGEKKRIITPGEQVLQEKIIDYYNNPVNLNDISGYTPMEFSPVDTLRLGTDSILLHVSHKYKGLNVASRTVRRQVEVLLTLEGEVIKDSVSIYFDALSKNEFRDSINRK